ncbi:MAG: homoserine dehydrogenase [Desulfovibrionaceae bacterium]|nr:homoserine dehydrogenase [Desulfovibrionaceae bacterium]
MLQPFVIGLAGLGTVGSGLVDMLLANRDDIWRRTGREIVLKSVAVRDTSKPRALPPGVALLDNPLALADDPAIQVIVELMGGKDAARDLIRAALKRGKSVVTANKALLAEDGEELFRLAHERGAALRYEASVAGAIPIVQTLKESLAGNHISSIMGILNGTSNYILSTMTSCGRDFPTALAQAQEQGLAEADPTLDIDGFDAAHKLTLLIRLAWGCHYPYSALSVQGIRGLRRMDIDFAREFGYRIKLIGQAREADGRIEAGVYPALVHHTLLLARVGGAYNAIRVEGNAVGSLFLHGLGAGSRPTASAVLGDLLSLAQEGARFKASANTGFVDADLPHAAALPASDAVSPWYVRAMVRDSSGVLRDIAGAMAAENVSMAQVIQKAERPDGVPLVFMTHATTGRAMLAAVRRLETSGQVLEPATCYRVLPRAGTVEDTALEQDCAGG